MLIVGFGGGVAVEGVPPTVSDIDVVELEPEVLHATTHDPYLGQEMVVGNDRRNGGEQSGRGVDERFGDARCNRDDRG